LRIGVFSVAAFRLVTGRGTMLVTGLVFFLVVIFLVVISPGSAPLLPGGDVKILRHDLVAAINVT